MTDLKLRPMNRVDAPAVKDLLAAAEAVDLTGEHYNVADVLEDFENPMIEPARDWVLAEVDGLIVGHARLMPRAPADGSISVALDGTVHPAHRHHGIGSRLVPLMVERAREYVRERGEDLRPVITGTAQSANVELASIFERQGLRAERWQFMMMAELGEETPAGDPLAEGYTVQTWEGVDHDELRSAHNRAFPGHPGFTPWSPEMWSQWVTESRNFRPGLSLLLRDQDGAIAAYLQTSEYDAVAEATGVREAYVAKVGTLEEHRRRGLAGVLLREALRRYREEGFDRAALDVDSENPTGALSIYEGAGFRTHLRWTDYRLEG